MLLNFVLCANLHIYTYKLYHEGNLFFQFMASIIIRNICILHYFICIYAILLRSVWSYLQYRCKKSTATCVQTIFSALVRACPQWERKYPSCTTENGVNIFEQCESVERERKRNVVFSASKQYLSQNKNVKATIFFPLRSPDVLRDIVFLMEFVVYSVKSFVNKIFIHVSIEDFTDIYKIY